jgi:hypothetical protein
MDLTTVTGWRKATYSSGNGGACIEVGNAGRIVAIRDSKDPHGPKLGFTPETWRAFTRSLKK